MSIYGGIYRVLSRDLSQLFYTAVVKPGTQLSISKRSLFFRKDEVFILKNVKYSTSNGKMEREGTYDNFTPERKNYLEKNEKDNKNILVEYHQQIKLFSHFVECSEETACELLNKFPFLKKADMEMVKQKFAALLEEGVAREELINDMWILSYSLEKLKEKLQLVKSMNCSPIKPWQLRCSKDVLCRLSQNKENNRLAMSPYQCLTDYICERLGLTEDQVLVFARKHPPVMRVKVAKLKEVIDFLFSEGFTANQIYYTPRILCHSLKTTQKRLAVLRAHNHEPYSLFVLCKSQRNFDNFIKNLKNSEENL